MQSYLRRHQSLTTKLHELISFFLDIRVQQVRWDRLIIVLCLHGICLELEGVHTQIFSFDPLPSLTNIHSHLLWASTGKNHPDVALSSGHSAHSVLNRFSF